MTDTTAVTSTPSTDAGNAPTDSATEATPTTAVDSATAPATETAQTTETKADEPQVPESYEFQMPEGVTLDKAAADEFTAIAKDLKLNQEQAQKVADIGAKMAQRQAEAHVRTVEGWIGEIKADKDFGGDKFDANMAVSRKALETFGSPELKDMLNATGLGNHPALIKAFFKAGQAISEDRFVTGAAPNGSQSDPAKRFFPNMN